MAASKLKQILQLDPTNDIVFQGPFEHVVTSYLELKNPSDRRVSFKVKTTAPKRYCVRPNSGIVEPNGKVKIAIMLQPLDPDSEAEARTKHKFMVQSTIIQSDDANIPLDELWQNAKPEAIMDSKLRCVFHSADQQDGDDLNRSKSGLAPAGTQPNAAATNLTSQVKAASQKAEQKQRSSGDSQASSEIIRTSTPVSPQATSSKWGASPASSSSNNQNLKYGQSSADKSTVSQHNLTSFMQPMSDDYKVVLVSLVMLVLGVILGKYII